MLADCFVTENAFDNAEDKHANSEENAEFDYNNCISVGNMGQDIDGIMLW